MSPSLPFDPIAEARHQWESRWGAEPAPAMAAVTSIMRAQQILMARLNVLLKPLALTFPRYEALMLLYLSRRGSLPLGKMGERLQVHPTSVMNLVDRLEHAGYLRRDSHAHDRRTTLATITEKGRIVAEEATASINAANFGVGPLLMSELDEITQIVGRLRIDQGDFSG